VSKQKTPAQTNECIECGYGTSDECDECSEFVCDDCIDGHMEWAHHFSEDDED
jgi:hypothetical protein